MLALPDPGPMAAQPGGARAAPRRHKVESGSDLPERFRVVAGSFAGPATAGCILPAMPLPADFNWTTRSASRPDEPLTVIACHGVWAVAMAQRVNDGIWIVSLDRHRHGPGGPFRWCSSAELWVAKREAKLREDVATILEQELFAYRKRLATLPCSVPVRGACALVAESW